MAKLNILSQSDLEEISGADPKQKIYTSQRYHSLFYKYPYLKRFKMLLGLLGDKKYNELLDVGFGSGIFLPELSNRCDNLYAIDIHQNINRVIKILTERNIRADIKRGNVLNIPFPDNKFDCITCLSVLEFVDNIEKAVYEISRVAKGGGKIIIGAPVLNKITDFCYSVLLGAKNQGSLHKSSHYKIINIVKNHLPIEKIEYFPYFLPKNLSLFFVLSATKNETF